MFTQTVTFLNISSTVCVPNRVVRRILDAIVMIKSSIFNFADRQLLRKTYADKAQCESAFRMALVFSVGLPRNSGGRFFHRDGFNLSLPERAGESMEKMECQRPEVLRNLTREVQLHGDIVLGDYEDTYYNLSLKLFHTFQWAAGLCWEHIAHQQSRPPVFILMDDDCAFNASHLKAELDGLSDAEIRRVTWGIPFDEARVIRSPFDKKNGKWALSKHEVPWPFHAHYAPSTFLVFGADVLQEIALAMHFTRQFPVDDAWLGLIMTKLDLHFERRAHMYQFSPKHVPKELVLAAPYKYLFGS
ncbi:unnamed protein product [Dibothriocephalus latus]|uniref:Hexosyltransferase n=1 Tax=Dibothriocephalus latus TaxID=60516 RepID=A0A3P7MH51_DIBLA|nr:unnamed protein product [Dibothriocephalus latus]